MSQSSNLFLQERENEQGLLSLSKSELYGKATDLTNGVVDGIVDPLRAYIEVVKRIELLEKMKEIIKPHAHSFAKIPKGGEMRYGAKIEEAEVGVKYDYSVCEDPIYNRLVDKLEEAIEAVKNREIVLKVSKIGDVFVDAETGESYKLKLAPLKTGKLGLKVTLK